MYITGAAVAVLRYAGPMVNAPHSAPGMASSAVPRRVGLAPLSCAETRLLLLGSFPSVASLNAAQYYAHPRNQFWALLGALFELDLPAMPYGARVDAVLHRGVGIWDVYAACRREGSLDASITAGEPNDLAGLVATLPRLRGIAHNGGASARFLARSRGLAAQVWRLPSSSPANASWSFARKLAAWREAFVSCGLIVR